MEPFTFGHASATRTNEKLDKNYFWNYQKYSPINYKVIEYDPTIEHFINPNDFNCKVMYQVAKAIERKENLASYFNNPGALRYSPFQLKQQDGFAVFKDYQTGFDALIYQLQIACDNRSGYYNSKMTVYEFFQVYAPSKDKNDPLKYAKDVVEWIGLRGINDPITDWLLTEIAWAKKYNYIPFLPYPDDSIVVDKSGSMSKILLIFKYLWNIIWKDK